VLFNSYEFIFFFLPVTAGVFYFLGRFVSKTLAIRWLILVSLLFYAWWRPLNVLLITPSILINFGLARLLLQLLQRDKRGLAKATLIVGIAFNVAFLGYFKYANFFVGVVDDTLGTNYVLDRIILPLGISFITFQKIAFLVDVAAKRVVSFTLQDYCLFVLFFPQLIAGPIVHYREVMPQFQRAACRYDKDNVAVGITLFFAGLFKKTFLADGIAPMVTAIYGQSTAGHSISFLYGWMAAIGFTLQMYFDFSGYSDMAIGIARLFGVRLPPNFNSPLRATSIIDFWLRWHMTLTRFLTAYLYNPLCLGLTRRRLARGLAGFGGRSTTIGSFVTLLMLPTIFTMCVSGLWHGAGYTFIFWGFLHGIFLTINHLWRLFARRSWPDRPRYQRIMAPVGFIITFLCVVTAMVYFKSPTMASAWNIVQGMAGLHGITIPPTAFQRLGPLAGWIRDVGVGLGAADDIFFKLWEWILALSALAFFAPNSLQILARYEPALGVEQATAYNIGPRLRLIWRTSFGWTAAAAVIAVVGVLHTGGVSEFLYWQF
jgi:D-alanyl-lipoteichoic acid acyltransferase DltB (MBOAT superfamily)